MKINFPLIWMSIKQLPGFIIQLMFPENRLFQHYVPTVEEVPEEDKPLDTQTTPVVQETTKESKPVEPQQPPKRKAGRPVGTSGEKYKHKNKRRTYKKKKVPKPQKFDRYDLLGD